MIVECYLIHDPINGGYWDNHSSSFRGIIFATKYPDEETAIYCMSKIPKNGYYSIQKIYQKNENN